MPQQPDRGDAVKAAETLSVTLRNLTDRLDKLTRYGHRNRFLVLVDVSLTIALAGLGVWQGYTARDVSAVHDQAAAASATASALHAAQVAGCQSGNELRKQELALWGYVIAATKPASAAQAAAIARFEVRVRATFKPRDCAKAYALPPAKADGGG